MAVKRTRMRNKGFKFLSSTIVPKAKVIGGVKRVKRAVTVPVRASKPVRAKKKR